MVVVSYMTGEPDYATLQNLTFATKTKEDIAATRASWDWREFSASGFVLLCILGAYLYFRASRNSSLTGLRAAFAPARNSLVCTLSSTCAILSHRSQRGFVEISRRFLPNLGRLLPLSFCCY